MSSALRERIYEIYKTFSEGDFDRLGDMFDENVDFVSNAPIEIFPYLGRRIGRAEVMKTLSAVHNEFEAVEYLPLRILVEDETAGLIVSIHLTQRNTKRLIRLFPPTFSGSEIIELWNTEHFWIHLKPLNSCLDGSLTRQSNR
jgi:hypothetical protein